MQEGQEETEFTGPKINGGKNDAESEIFYLLGKRSTCPAIQAFINPSESIHFPVSSNNPIAIWIWNTRASSRNSGAKPKWIGLTLNLLF